MVTLKYDVGMYRPFVILVFLLLLRINNALFYRNYCS